MGMTVVNSYTRKYDPRYASPVFKATVEQNIDYSVRRNNYTIKSIDPHLAYSYQGNLYGLFAAMGIHTDYHVYTAYINGYNSPHDYDGTVLTFKMLNTVVIDNISQIFF